MLGEESAIFPKQIKLDDYSPYEEGNVLCILESSNLLLGTGARTSHPAVVLAKTLHFLSEEGTLSFDNKYILQIGCGVGLLGIYLSCLGGKVLLADLPSMRDLVERNIGINKSLIKGKADFIIVNWKAQNCVGKCEQINELHSTTSSERQQCLVHLIDRIDLTVVCQCGGLADLRCHLRWLGKDGMILCFLERQQNQDGLSFRGVQEELLSQQLNYQRIDQYHPDYVDQRIGIYHIWK